MKTEVLSVKLLEDHPVAGVGMIVAAAGEGQGPVNGGKTPKRARNHPGGKSGSCCDTITGSAGGRDRPLGV